MRKIYHILKGFRITVSIPAAFLVHIGYKIVHEETNWGLVILIFFITALTMLQNDYFDRDHDQKKGKDFASKNKKFLLVFLVVCWLVVVITSFLFFENKLLWLLIIIGIGILYSFSRFIVLLPLVTVAITSASPIVLSKIPDLSTQHLLLFISIIFAILGREILKDIEDREVDVGYKETLLTSGLTTIKQACLVSGVSVAIGTLLTLVIRNNLGQLPYAIYLAGLVLMTTSVFFIVYFNEVKNGKRFFDLGMLSILVALSI